MNEIKLIQIEPTTRCNFTCQFCCGRKMKQQDLDFYTYKIAIDEIHGIECIELQGEGEPFLNPHIYDMISYAVNKGIKVSSISNGSLLTKENVDKILVAGLDSLNISIESPSVEEFRKIRGGNLEKIKEGIAYLSAEKKRRGLKKPAIGFSVTLLKSTASWLQEIFSLYKELDMDGGISIQFLNQSTSYSAHYTSQEFNEYLTLKEQHIIRMKYFRLLQEIRVNNQIEHFFTRLENISKVNSGKMGYCTWLENALYINCKGDALPCVYIKDGERFTLGNIKEEGVKSILENREKMQAALKCGEFCEACDYVKCEPIMYMRHLIEKE